MSQDCIRVRAGAKINLTLDVLGPRGDGYHDMRMLMQTVGLYDTLEIRLQTGQEPRVTTNLPYLPAGRKNLAGAAADAFFSAAGIDPGGYGIAIQKAIPVCAGLAGGSADAAAVLRALNGHYGGPLSDTELYRLGETIGSDVPFCILGGTALAEGRGERLTPLKPMPPCAVLLCKPDFPVSTGKLFSQLDRQGVSERPDTQRALEAIEAGDLSGIAGQLFNVFEAVLDNQEVWKIKSEMLGGGALGSCMSGTGPTVFGLFQLDQDAQRTKDRLMKRYKDVFLTKTE